MRDLHPRMLEERIYNLEERPEGSGDYEDLANKPKIENTELVGNLTFEDLGVASADDLAQTNDDLLDVQQVANQNHADIGTINSKLGVVPDDESIEDQISNINNNLNNLLKLANSTLQFTLEAGKFNGFIVPATVIEGYSCIGVVAVNFTDSGRNSFTIGYHHYQASGNRFQIAIKNNHTAELTNTVVIVGLYLKNN